MEAAELAAVAHEGVGAVDTDRRGTRGVLEEPAHRVLQTVAVWTRHWRTVVDLATGACRNTVRMCVETVTGYVIIDTGMRMRTQLHAQACP